MVDSVCFFVTHPAGDIIKMGQLCRCDSSGRMKCPGEGRNSGAVSVCVAKTGASCPASTDSQASAALAAKFEPGCPLLLNPTLSGEQTTPAGEASCCYKATLGLCQGRPLAVEGLFRIARIQRGSWA